MSTSPTLVAEYVRRRVGEGLPEVPEGWELDAFIQSGSGMMSPLGNPTAGVKVYCRRCLGVGVRVRWGTWMMFSDLFSREALGAADAISDGLASSLNDAWRVRLHSCKYEQWRHETRPWMDRISHEAARLPGAVGHDDYLLYQMGDPFNDDGSLKEDK